MIGNRRLRWLIFAFLLYLAFCSVGGILLADGALHPTRRSLTREDASAFAQRIQPLHAVVQNVSITAPDAAILRAALSRCVRCHGIVFAQSDDRRGAIAGGHDLIRIVG